MQFWVELVIILLCLFAGARIGGIGLGAFSGVGLVILVFGFHILPTSPPIDVLLMVLAVTTGASVLQAAGGLNYMVMLAERALRKHPERVTFVAPLISYFFTFVTGTGHVVYAVLPVIAEVSRDAGVRPERPLSVSVIASQQAITACPISAAVVSLLAILGDFNITLIDILMVCVPSTLIGCMAAAFSVRKMGVELEEDPIYQQKLQEGSIASLETITNMSKNALLRARLSVATFLAGIGVIVALASFPALRPFWMIDGIRVNLHMPLAIEMIMLSVAAIILCFKVKGEEALEGSVERAGFVAVICIFGIAWLGNTFAAGNAILISKAIGSMVAAFPASFVVALFVLSILLYSQAATVLALMPLGVALKVPAPFLVAMFPAVNGFFFLPTYGTMLAAIALDQTGTTKIGKYVLNHSFMRPGWVAIVVSVSVGFGLSWLIL